MLKSLAGTISNLMGSEKALAAFGVLAGATVLTALGHMTVDQWQETALWALGIYTVGKTVQGATSTIAAAKEQGQKAVADKLVEAVQSVVSDSTATTKRPPSQG